MEIVELGEKGDVNRYMLYSVILLILILVIIGLYLTGANQLIKSVFIKGMFG